MMVPKLGTQRSSLERWQSQALQLGLALNPGLSTAITLVRNCISTLHGYLADVQHWDKKS